MIKLGAVIMAHRDRAEFVPKLQRQLDRPVDVVWDQKNDRWDTGSRAMAAFDRSATHHLVIQDDAVVPRDLIAGVEKALAYVPAMAPVALYTGRIREFIGPIDRELRTHRRASWLRMPDLNWGVGIVVPTETITDMLAWCEKRSDVPNYDGRVGEYYRHVLGQWTWYPWPSLVDHRHSPSLVAGRTSMRSAYRFLGARRSAATQRYDGSIVTVNVRRSQR